jgi:hypothetical protein
VVVTKTLAVTAMAGG